MKTDAENPERTSREEPLTGSEIAIIGMACRFPGAVTVEQFWDNLCGGVESLSLLTDRELEEAGVDTKVRQSKYFVRRAPVIDGVELFDADFFGYTELEAKLMDPQQRLFLECAWESLEKAAYDPARYQGAVGVFTGAKTNTYLLNLFSDREFFRSVDSFQVALGNDLACMATRVSYKLDLKGPSYALHTACSTSLVAVHLACQSLLIDECQMALAGGAAVNVPQRKGYLYQPGGILSPDGSCRTFDARAAGSNFGNGAGCVLLKRLPDALADGDHIHAVLRGSATNNDGAAKASFMAPGVEGQSSVILEALACADAAADSISYLEAHGTATDLGDSIEMLALTEAFRANTPRQGFCALGSVKTNIGHLETAAGVAGLIKTALALEHRQIPPSLHFEAPNPKIDFASSPFYVNTELEDWPAGTTRRRAGLSSFGIGSTNAHAILEEAPPVAPGSPSRQDQLLLLSARTPSALAAATERLAQALRRQPDLSLADAAYSLQVGRKRFEHRRAVVCRQGEAAEVLESLPSDLVHTAADDAQERPVAFLLPGLGDQAVGLARGLYETEATFRELLDRCAGLLERELGEDLRSLLYPDEPADQPTQAKAAPSLKALLRSGPGDGPLDSTARVQPALFAVELCLARQWMEWGIRPQALLGYSLGEYAAACLAEVLSLEDALTLVARRAKLIGQLPPGAMLAVSLGEAEIRRRLGGELTLAAVNGPGLTVVAGPVPAVTALQDQLRQEGIACQPLATRHAFHSPLLAPVAAPLTELVASFRLSPPKIPYLSNVTGTWIRAEEATDPAYWARHMVEPVRFEEGVAALLADSRRIVLEMGTGQSLASFVKVHPSCSEEAAGRVFASLPGRFSSLGDAQHVQLTLGKVWAAGGAVDWPGYYRRQRRLRVPLPTYPFERRRYWVDGVAALRREAAGADPAKPQRGDKKADLGEWFYQRHWPEEALAAAPTAAGPWLLFVDGAGLGQRLAEALKAAGQEVVTVDQAEAFERRGEGLYALRPGVAEDYRSLLTDLRARGLVPRVVYHGWGVSAGGEAAAELLDATFYSVLFLVQALGRQGGEVTLGVITTGAQRVFGDEPVQPEKATVLGPVKVAPQEIQGLSCRSVDLLLDEVGDPDLARRLMAELSTPSEHRAVAYRRGRRRVEAFEPSPLPAPERSAIPLRQGGTYLITGGLGGVGRVLAGALAHEWQAKLVLTRRSPLPARELWDSYLQAAAPEDATAAVLRDLLAFEEAGAEVLVGEADVTDEAAMAQVLAAARQRFGPLHGVLHAAGVGGGGLIQLKTRQEAAAVLAAKVHGTRVLQRLLAAEPPDFLLLFSSLQSVLGDFGQADYCAANAFLDAVAEAEAETGAAGLGGPRVLAAGWDNFQEVGIAVNTQMPEHLRAWQEDLLSRAITRQEGVQIFERLLAAGRPRLVITTQELEGRLRESRYYTSQKILEEFGGGARGASGGAGSTGAAALGDGSPLDRPELERHIARIWCRVLGKEKVKADDNFFDLGGNSLLGMQLINQINQELGTEVPPVVLFEAPTVGALAAQLAPAEAPQEAPAVAARAVPEQDSIAVVGMTGRFPGAQNLDQLWENLRSGIESTRRFTDQELEAAGVSRQELDSRTYVKARPVLDDVELFDAELFGVSPREAEVMDPQHRLFLECAWEALETAACDPQRFPGRVGVYAGCAISTYLLNLHSHPELMDSVGTFQVMIGNEKDSMPTRVSYKLNLTGPSVAVQTFCSSSLVAVHLAARSLLAGECDLALAGGASIHLPQTSGYHYQEGGFVSSDGRVKAFDSSADGFTFGNGVAVVVLKRLADAQRDGDPIRAVIRASAVNNDGSLKVGYTATSVEGQSKVIAEALAASGLKAEQIGYIEAHGTGTRLGDPVEIAALTKAFRTSTQERGYCPIGSIKTNIGHLDRAAGATGLIKAVLTLERQEIPASLHLETPNPEIDFAASPFFVNTRLRPWLRGEEPRRAGVNSLGLGGTNAHVILEEAPPAPPSGPSRPWQLLLLSAQSPASLEGAQERLRSYLEEHPEASLPDVAHTLHVGRRFLRCRRAVVARDRDDALAALGPQAAKRCQGAVAEVSDRRPVFLFPGLGGQYLGMGRGLYEGEEVFRQAVDRAVALLEPELGLNLLEVLFAEEEAKPEDSSPVDLRGMLGRGRVGGAGEVESEAARRLRQTRYSQPSLFVVQYALAQLWLSWGVEPQALAGYSIGEYVAACLAGVLRLEDALRLVARRAQLIEALPGGAMLAVSLPEDKVLPLIGEALSLAAVNGPEQSVVAGSLAAIAALEEHLAQDGVASRRLQVSHAFHSHLLQPVFDDLVELVSGFDLQPPQRPLLSNLTGRWMTVADATDPTYWARHMVGTVRFADAVEELCRDDDPVLLEIGPQALSSLVLQHPASGPQTAVVSCLRHAYETQEDVACLMQALGRLWLAGVGVRWQQIWQGEERRRLVLPTYAFDRQRYWVERNPDAAGAGAGRRRFRDPAAQISIPVWHRKGPPRAAIPAPAPASASAPGWWLFTQGDGLGAAVQAGLKARGCSVLTVSVGSEFQRLADDAFVLDPQREEDFHRLCQEAESAADGLLFLWSLPSEPRSGEESPGPAAGASSEEQGFAALLRLGRALAEHRPAAPLRLWVAAAGGHEVTGGEELRPRQLLPFAAAAALERSVEGVRASCLDLEMPKTNGDSLLRLGERLIAELVQAEPPSLTALRGPHRWLPETEELAWPAPLRPLAAGSCYLVLNGLGDLGHGWTTVLSEVPAARLALVEGVGFPAREQWQPWLDNDPAAGLISRKIGRIQALEKNGCQVEVLAADPTDVEALGAIVESLVADAGTLSGLVSCFEAEGAEPVAALALKLRSLETLEALIRDAAPAFGLVVSSAGASGPAASAADCAVGLCLDGVAQRLSRDGGTSWSSVAWELGSTADALSDDQRRLIEAVLAGAPSCASPQLILSQGGLEPSWTRLRAHAQAAAPEAPQNIAYYARPTLQVDFVAPRTPVEETVAGIWRDLLGVERVGVYDNFLDLGGDSLLATRLISRMRDAFHLDFPIRLFFEASTVDELAAAVEAKRASLEDADLAELTALLDGMSEEEIEAELNRRKGMAEATEASS